MQQVRCNQCEVTKFFLNSIGGTQVLMCSGCGASYLVNQELPKEAQTQEDVQVQPQTESLQQEEQATRIMSLEEKDTMLKSLAQEGDE